MRRSSAFRLSMQTMTPTLGSKGQKAWSTLQREAPGIPHCDVIHIEIEIGIFYLKYCFLRCTMCFDMRMDRTALYAKENGFHVFTTTNATSRWKDINQVGEKPVDNEDLPSFWPYLLSLYQVNASGIQAAAKYEGIEYW